MYSSTMTPISLAEGDSLICLLDTLSVLEGGGRCRALKISSFVFLLFTFQHFESRTEFTLARIIDAEN